MNVAQAKAIPLEEILSKQGYEPVETRKNGRELWYFSPFRDEKTPSFVIDTVENIWNDFAESGNQHQNCAGGKVIDYMIKHQNTDVSGALSALKQLFGGQVPQNRRPHSEGLKLQKNELLKVLSIKPVFSDALFQYLQSRKIDRKLVDRYLKQILFLNIQTGSQSFALGFKNDIEGFEIRNKYFKGLIGERSITAIEGQGDHKSVQLIEGFFDFLSLMTIYQKETPISDVIVLNGATMIQAAIDHIKTKDYAHIQTWFDNDKGGSNANDRLKKAFSNASISIKPQNEKYYGFKDVNELLTSLESQAIQDRFGLGT